MGEYLATFGRASIAYVAAVLAAVICLAFFAPNAPKAKAIYVLGGSVAAFALLLFLWAKLALLVLNRDGIIAHAVAGAVVGMAAWKLLIGGGVHPADFYFAAAGAVAGGTYRLVRDIGRRPTGQDRMEQHT